MSENIYDELRVAAFTQEPNDRDDLKVGDLWLLSWESDYLALVVVTKVFDDYVLGYPVTMPNYPSFSPAVVQNDNKLEVPLAIWPVAETGLGKHLFNRSLGHLLSERTVDLLRRYSEDGHESPLPIADGDYRDGNNSEFLRELLVYMQELCFHERTFNNKYKSVIA